MKRMISAILSIMLISNIFVSVQTASASAEVNLPAYDCELGFIFMTDGVQYNNTKPDDYEGVDDIAAEINIYYADSLEALTNISDKFNITSWEENRLLDIPEEPEIPLEDVVDNTINLFSLFSEEISADDNTTNENITDEPYVNDPWFERQWYYEAVHAQAYRDNGIDGTGVKVGIIDTGLDYKAIPEFPNTEDTLDFEGANVESVINVPALIDNNKERLKATFSDRHGTVVTSVIAAQTNNGVGIAGLTDRVEIRVYKKQDPICTSTANSAAVYTSIRMAYEDGCDVVNMSFGGMYFDDDIERELIDYATQDGMIMIAASGNEGDNADEPNKLVFPAACEKVIGVGAIKPSADKVIYQYKKDNFEVIHKGNFQDSAERNEVYSSLGLSSNDVKEISGYFISQIRDLKCNEYLKCDFSSSNESVFISAPGEDIYTIGGLKVNNASMNSGTSVAAPIVTSAAIGVKQMRPYVDSEMFKEILRATAVDLDEEGYDINTGYGMVDFQAIYDYVSQMPEAIAEDIPEISVDYGKCVLNGFSDEKVYIINGEEKTSNLGEISLDTAWYGTNINIQTKATEDYHIDSEVQELYIPAIPDAPDIRYEIIFDEEGSISCVNGISDELEFRKVGMNTWETGEITDSGQYEIRYKATENSFAGISYVITFNNREYDIETAVSYENGVVNYSYNNHTGRDIAATGIIAVYDSNNVLVKVEILVTLINGQNDGSFAVESDISSIKFFTWDSLNGMKPHDKAEMSEWNKI